jgi:hypothetical protein
MLPIRPTTRFKKDLKRAAKQNRDLKFPWGRPVGSGLNFFTFFVRYVRYGVTH